MYIYKIPTKKFKYVFDFTFDWNILEFCRSLKTELGPKGFNFELKKWRFNNLLAVYKIMEKYPTAQIDKEVMEDFSVWQLEQRKKQRQIEKANELKAAKNTDFVVRNIRQDLYPYQKIGVEFFINNGGKAILADQMGLGKTAQALAYLAHERKEKSLVICPASTKYSWNNEVKKWTKFNPFVINGDTELNWNAISEHDIFIINYDLLKKFFTQLESLRIDAVILDEFHYIKNATSMRTKLAMALAKKIPSILLLSGTPMLNRPVELYNGLHLMDPENWNDWYKFTVKYCKGHQSFWGWEAKGASNIDELQKKISRYFLRRIKEDVLTELPPKQFIDYPVDLDAENWKKYVMAEQNFVHYLKTVKKRSVDRATQASKLVALNELRQITSSGKIWAAKEIIQNVIDSGQKIIVFSVYREPLKELLKHFGDDAAVMITGETSAIERQKIIDRFQKEESVKIFFGGIKSAGVGITLTAASTVLFIDYSWVPADHAQAADRVHRIGQTADKVTIYQLFSLNTIDDTIRGILAGKQALFNKIIEGIEEQKKKDAVQQASVVDDLLKMLSSKEDKINPKIKKNNK